jgi:hypothetical protein
MLALGVCAVIALGVGAMRLISGPARPSIIDRSTCEAVNSSFSEILTPTSYVHLLKRVARYGRRSEDAEIRAIAGSLALSLPSTVRANAYVLVHWEQANASVNDLQSVCSAFGLDLRESDARIENQ